MPRYSVPLKAGKASRLPYPGRSLQIVDAGAAGTVQLQVEWGGDQQNTEDYGAFGSGDGIKAGTSSFLALSLTSAADTIVDLLVSRQDVAMVNGQAVDASIVGTVPVSAAVALPVSTDRGQNVGAPLFVSGQVLGDTPAANVTDNAAVAASPVVAALLAADATRLEAVIYNIGPDPVAIGMVGLTWAKRAIVLNAGDAWIESRAASKAWYCITDAAKAASVTVQERKS